MGSIAPENAETEEAWDGVLYERFGQVRKVMVNGLAEHGERALRMFPPTTGDRVLDIGSGFGDTAQVLAAMVGGDGQVLGVDISKRFVETATAEAAEAGVENVAFRVSDVQTETFDEQFDYAYSRFGTMFFANPVAAMRNVREGMAAGGRLCMVVWRRKLDSPFFHEAEVIVKSMVEEPDETDEPTCGPGPFSMADADTTSAVLLSAGFEEIEFHRSDVVTWIGDDAEEAIEMITAIGPAGERIRLAGEAAERIRPEIDARLREMLAEYVTPEGVQMGSSTWTVAARAPG